MSEELERRQKIGAGHVAAMGRAGLKELSQTLQAFPGQGIQPVEEPGLAGNPTPQEVVQSKGRVQDLLDGKHIDGMQQDASREMER